MSQSSTGHFKFKQFSLWHDLCAMKVSTDGVALGAWSKLAISAFNQTHPNETKSNTNKIQANQRVPEQIQSHPEMGVSVLDIGTGTGLLSLMLAQRYSSENVPVSILALEINEDAAKQAVFNFEQSPWSKSDTVEFKVKQKSVQHWSGTYELHFDQIICNPPYFSQSLKSEANQARDTARHNDVLPFDELAKIAATHLKPDGHFDVILPIEEAHRFVKCARRVSLILEHHASLQHSENKVPNRYLMRFVKVTSASNNLNMPHHELRFDEPKDAARSTQTLHREKTQQTEQPLSLETKQPQILGQDCETIIVRDKDGQFHPTFANYTKDFYLKL